MPCLKDMENGGVIPVSNLDVTSVIGASSTVFTLKSPKQTTQEPEWEEVTLMPGNAKTITVTPIGKDGNR